eukprot:5445131-Amphidinium_carterae.2
MAGIQRSAGYAVTVTTVVPTNGVMSEYFTVVLVSIVILLATMVWWHFANGQQSGRQRVNQAPHIDAAPAAHHGKGSGVAATAAHHSRGSGIAVPAAYPGRLKYVYRHKSSVYQCEAVHGRPITSLVTRQEACLPCLAEHDKVFMPRPYLEEGCEEEAPDTRTSNAHDHAVTVLLSGHLGLHVVKERALRSLLVNSC